MINCFSKQISFFKNITFLVVLSLKSNYKHFLRGIADFADLFELFKTLHIYILSMKLTLKLIELIERMDFCKTKLRCNASITDC